MATFPDDPSAQYWAAVLRDEGIRSTVRPLSGAAFGRLARTPHGLYVQARDAERAKELLEEATHSSQHKEEGG